MCAEPRFAEVMKLIKTWAKRRGVSSTFAGNAPCVGSVVSVSSYESATFRGGRPLLQEGGPISHSPGLLHLAPHSGPFRGGGGHFCGRVARLVTNQGLLDLPPHGRSNGDEAHQDMGQAPRRQLHFWRYRAALLIRNSPPS